MSRLAACLTLLLVTGCARPEWEGLRRARGDDVRPALISAFEGADAGLLAAIDRSADWLDSPAAVEAYRDRPAERRRVRGGLLVLRRLLEESGSGPAFAALVEAGFEVLEARGRDGSGEVLFTAYYAPEHPARLRPDGRFAHPLYAAPPDLAPGATWHARRDIEARDLCAGLELAWLASPLDVYLVQVNGSARLILEDGSAMCVGHAATNGRPYTSLGRLLIEVGRSRPEDMSMQKIRELFEREPELVGSLMRRNDRFVFFEERPADRWPLSSLGMVLTPGRSMASDKALFPPGAAAIAVTTLPDGAGGTRPFVQLVVDQDSGGAIRSAGRADLYLGAGAAAGAIAGRQRATGRLLYLRLRDAVGVP